MASVSQPNGSATSGGISLTETKRGKCLLGQLPSEFLRLSAPSQPQAQQDTAMAYQLALQQQQAMAQTAALATATRLNVTVVEAKLNKNYGVTKMDPYCRITIDQRVFETATAQNGAKSPYWGKTVSAQVKEDLKDIFIEIYDERVLSGDSRIAWCRRNLSESLKKGTDEDEWLSLDGKLGEGKEGLVHVQLSWRKVQQPLYYNAPIPMLAPQMYNPAAVPITMLPPGAGYFTPQGNMYPQPQRQVIAVSDQDLKQVKEMFPNIEDEVIRTVLEASRGNKDAAINSLLSMQPQ